MCLRYSSKTENGYFPPLKDFTANESNSTGAGKRMRPVKQLLSVITSKQSCFPITAQDSQRKQHAGIQ